MPSAHLPASLTASESNRKPLKAIESIAKAFAAFNAFRCVEFQCLKVSNWKHPNFGFQRAQTVSLTGEWLSTRNGLQTRESLWCTQKSALHSMHCTLARPNATRLMSLNDWDSLFTLSAADQPLCHCFNVSDRNSFCPTCQSDPIERLYYSHCRDSN